MAIDDELVLVTAARQGDNEALQILLTRNWRWLKGLVYGVVSGQGDLDDVMQDICLRVLTRIHTVRDPQRFRAWLAILARREALRYRRRRASRGRGAEELTALGRSAGRIDDPAENLEKRELCERVLKAVQALPGKYREVFMLAHSGALSYAQMAQVLRVPVTTMQIRLVRARRMVREQIVRSSERDYVESEHDG